MDIGAGNSRDTSLERKDGSSLAAIPSNAREVADIGLKVVPQSGIGRDENHGDFLVTHQFSNARPPSIAFHEGEAWNALNQCALQRDSFQSGLANFQVLASRGSQTCCFAPA